LVAAGREKGGVQAVQIYYVTYLTMFVLAFITALKAANG